LVNADLVALDDPDKVYTQKAARWAEPRMDEAIRWLQTLARNPDQRQQLAEAGKAKALAVLGGRAIEALHGTNRTDRDSAKS